MTSWISVVCPSIMSHNATCFYCICDFKKNTLFPHYCYFYFLFQRITWNPLEAHRDLCLLKGKSEVSRRRCEAMVWKLPDMHHVWLLVTTEATVGWCCVILLTFTGVTAHTWRWKKSKIIHTNFIDQICTKSENLTKHWSLSK